MITLEIKKKYNTRWRTTSNLHHRLNRSASFERYSDGKKRCETWVQYGKRHRDSNANKPAFTYWNFYDSTLNYRSYWIHGQHIRSECL